MGLSTEMMHIFFQVQTYQKMMWLLLLTGLGCMWWMIRSRFSWNYHSLK